MLASEHGHTTIKSSTTLIITQSDFTSDIAAGVVLRHPTKYNIIVMRDSRDWETRAKGQSGNTTSAPIMIDVKDKNDVSMSRSLPEVIVATLDTIPMDMTLHTMEKCIFFEPETSDTIREISFAVRVARDRMVCGAGKVIVMRPVLHGVEIEEQKRKRGGWTWFTNATRFIRNLHVS